MRGLLTLCLRRSLFRFTLACCASVFAPAHVLAESPDFLTAQGYSGLGLIPSGRALEAGRASLDYGKAIPGHPSPRGHNIQVGFGLTPGLELVGRIATQDLHCNLFRSAAECPPQTIRDFSASIKWSPKLPLLSDLSVRSALGASDVGGAAVKFQTYYGVLERDFGPLTGRVGFAKRKGPLAILDGAFASLDLAIAENIRVSFQKVGDNEVFAFGLATPSWLGAYGKFQYNRSLDKVRGLPSDWISYGVSIPLDSSATLSPRGKPFRVVHSISPLSVEAELERNGFFFPRVDASNPSLIKLEVENTGYLHDPIDAAGVALGVVAGAYGRGDSETRFDLLVTHRGIGLLRVTGSSNCILRWINLDQPCNDIQLSSALQQGWHVVPFFDLPSKSDSLKALLKWRPRLELQASPVITSAVATEYGWLDADLGMNYNLILPLWRGALFEVNRLEPLDIRHESFEPGGVFYGARLRSAINRRMFHQILSVPTWNTQVRFTRGMAYSSWKGWQFESQTFSTSGRHRLSTQVGRFENAFLRTNRMRSFELFSYRYAYAGYPNLTAELTYGEYWNGDRGYTVSQTFWNGDTAISVYLRQSRYSGGPEASFAGISFSVPMTPRKNRGYRYFGLRGSSQWTYSLETRVFDDNNRIGGGYGVVPRMGDPLAQIFNRDRNSTEYFNTYQWRIKDSFRRISSDD